MEDLPNLYLRHLQSRLGDIALELTRIRYSGGAVREAWHPAINAYRCQGSIVICVDLAGVDRSQIQLRVEPGRLWLRGVRLPLEPASTEGPPMAVLAMEIDQGPFEREIVLPADVDPTRAEATSREGLLWIRLPLLHEP